uniref:Uncharacterized protein n=1 Tax=Amphimedon queenslandica TaxID=400682 RepID=A0A1X7ULR1_AMPQE
WVLIAYLIDCEFEKITSLCFQQLRDASLASHTHKLTDCLVSLLCHLKLLLTSFKMLGGIGT